MCGGRQLVTHGDWRLAYDIIKTPVDIIENAVFDIRGQSYHDIRTISKNDPQQKAIFKKLEKSKDTNEIYNLNFLQISKEENFCAPWSLKNEQCSCEQVCPLSFSLFSINKDQIASKSENSLAKLNHAFDYWDGHNLGHCWGHAVFTQKIKRLAIFRADLKAPYADGSKKWVEFYTKILKNIANDQAQIVPGFSNIKEFTGHPRLVQKVANRVSQMWGEKSMSLEGFAQSSFAIPGFPKKNLNYINKIKNRLLNHQQVAVLMGYKIPVLTLRNLHVNLVSRVIEGNGLITVCYEDNNSTGDENRDCRRKDIFGLDGSLKKSWWGPKTIVYHENHDAAKQLRSLWKMCHQACEKSQNIKTADNALDFNDAMEKNVNLQKEINHKYLVTGNFKNEISESCDKSYSIVRTLPIDATDPESAVIKAQTKKVSSYACGKSDDNFSWSDLVSIDNVYEVDNKTYHEPVVNEEDS